MKSIPNEIIKDISDIVINKEMSLDEKALQVFQLFTKISIFIDYKLYLNLKRRFINIKLRVKIFIHKIYL